MQDESDRLLLHRQAIVQCRGVAKGCCGEDPQVAGLCLCCRERVSRLAAREQPSLTGMLEAAMRVPYLCPRVFQHDLGEHGSTGPQGGVDHRVVVKDPRGGGCNPVAQLPQHRVPGRSCNHVVSHLQRREQSHALQTGMRLVARAIRRRGTWRGLTQ